MEHFSFKPMDKHIAETILNWQYEKPYDFYNNEYCDESLSELLDSSYYAIFDNQQLLIGFFCTGNSAQIPIGHKMGVYLEDCIDLGLGMNPTLVGKGNGYQFLAAILTFIQNNYEQKPIRLSVATFNLRAIKLYKNLGFKIANEFSTDRATFLSMIKSD